VLKEAMSLVVLLVSSADVGNWILRPFGLGRSLEIAAYRIFLGLGICAVMVLLIGSVSLVAAQLALNIFAVLGLGYELLVYSRRAGLPADVAKSRTPLGFFEWISVAAIAGALALALLSALVPATGWDACVAHLSLPRDYAREGRIQLIEGNEYSAYPHLVHCLFAYAFAQGGETAVLLVSWAFGALACVGAVALGRRTEDRRCGLIAAAILATTPIFMDQGGTASVDLAFCAFTLAALAGLAAWCDEKKPGWLFLSAFLVGSSCGIRHTGYLVGLLLVLGVLMLGGPGRLRAAFTFGAMAMIAALPWLLRSALLVGNPFYPFFSEWFGSDRLPHWHVSALGAHSSIQSTGLLSLIRFPVDIILRPHLYDGWTKSPGGLVLFLGLPGLLVGNRRCRALGAFSGAGIACFYFFQRLARYLLPFFAPMMIVAAVAACRLRSLRHAIAALLAVTFLYGLALDVAAVHFKIPVVFGIESREDYLARRVERYQAFEWVNEHIPPEDIILTFDRRTYYIKGRTFQNDEPLRRLNKSPVYQQVGWLRAHHIKWVFLPVTYIEESAGHRAAFLSMVNTWRRFSRYFTLVRGLDVPRTRGEGTEHVEIYEVHYD